MIPRPWSFAPNQSWWGHGTVAGGKGLPRNYSPSAGLVRLSVLLGVLVSTAGMALAPKPSFQLAFLPPARLAQGCRGGGRAGAAALSSVGRLHTPLRGSSPQLCPTAPPEQDEGRSSVAVPC